MLQIKNAQNPYAAEPYGFYDEYEAVWEVGVTHKLIIASYDDEYECAESNQIILGNWLSLITQKFEFFKDGTVFVAQSFGEGFKVVSNAAEAYVLLASGDKLAA
jgi:hypothetical protein